MQNALTPLVSPPPGLVGSLALNVTVAAVELAIAAPPLIFTLLTVGGVRSAGTGRTRTPRVALLSRSLLSAKRSLLSTVTKMRRLPVWLGTCQGTFTVTSLKSFSIPARSVSPITVVPGSPGRPS